MELKNPLFRLWGMRKNHRRNHLKRGLRDADEHFRLTRDGKSYGKKFRTMVERSIQGIVIIQDFRVVYSNRAFSKISGYSRKELLYLTPTQVEKVIHADHRDLVWGRMKTRLQGHKVIPRYEYKGIRKDGSIRWLEMLANLIEYEGKPAILGAIIDITDRKRAEEKLKESEERYKAIIDLAPDGMVTADIKGVITSCNSAFLEQTGLPKAALVGKHFSKLPSVYKSDIAAYFKVLASLIKAKPMRPFEAKWKHKDGSVRWGEIHVAPLKEGRKITGFQAITRDITDRRNTEKALRDSEKKYRNIVESSPMGMHLYQLKPNGQLVFIGSNPAADRILGVDNSQFVGKTIEEAFPPLADTEIPKKYKEAAAKGIAWQTNQVSYKDEKINGAFQVHAFQTSPQKMAAMFLDITEKMKAEEALQESEEKYRAIFESFHDVYYRTDREGLVTLISPSVRNHAGWDPEDIIGHPVTDFYQDPSERENFKEKLKESGVINDYELKLLAKNGRVIAVSVSSKIIFSKDGHPIGVEGVLRDITDRKRAEEQVKSSLKEKEVLLQEIHHRVKNNMQIISSLLNLQLRHIGDDRVRDMFKMSRDRIKSMALIHEKLYQSEDLSRVNFAQYIRSLSLHLLHTYNANADRIKLDTEVIDVFLDINKAIPCGLILNELVSNSLKHAFPQNKRGTIRIQLSAGSNGDVRLGVSDNGVGFSENVDLQKPDSMGLQLVNDLVEQLGGTLELDLGEGTSYQISFEAGTS